MKNLNHYPIKAAAIKSGLTAHVIRAWEKRYNVLVPNRTDTNRRLYSEKDIEKLILLKRATESGHNIGSIAGYDLKALKDLLRDEIQQPLPRKDNQTTNTGALFFLNACLNSVKDFDAGSFEKILMKASMQLTQPVFIDFVVLPLLNQIGQFWRNGDIRIMHEHMASAVLKPFLSNLRNSYRPPENAPCLIVTTPLGQVHELGALVISIIAAAEGWQVVYLGPDLPAEEIAAAAIEKKAAFVVLSIVYPADDPYLKIEFEKLKQLLPNQISIIAGGRLAQNYKTILEQIGAYIMDDTNEFRSLLSSKV